jgi:T-complex protein 1 subunit theta
MGDGTNLVIILAGELLKKAESILLMGLHPSEVIQGYEMALLKALDELESLCFHATSDVPHVMKLVLPRIINKISP